MIKNNIYLIKKLQITLIVTINSYNFHSLSKKLHFQLKILIIKMVKKKASIRNKSLKN